MRALLRAEWLRQRRRPDLWLLPVVALLAAVWAWQTGLTSAEHSLDMPPGFPVAPDEEVAKLRDPYAFPAGFHAILTGGFLAFIAMVHYGASWTGSEFVRGTIRNIFLVHPARLPFIAVRLAALATLALVFVVVFVAVAAAMPALRGIAPSPTATPPSLAGLAVYAAAGWFALWFLALGATVLSVVLRSAASAILLIFGYVLAELVVGNAPIWQEVGQLAWLPELLPVGRLIQGLSDVAVATGFSQASAGEASPPVVVPPVVGLAILAAWTLLFGAVLARRIRFMDIGE